MKSIVICEGGTDLTLIQYFMEKVHGWTYIEKKLEKQYSDSVHELANCKLVRWFIKNNNFMAIASVGGCTNIKNRFSEIVEFNKISALPSIAFDNIVIITDRDEITTEKAFISEISDVLNNSVSSFDVISNSLWSKFEYLNASQDEKKSCLLLLVIPFEDTGALETFLLKTIGEKDNTGTEKKIIKQCNYFVDHIDTDKKYLQHRRHVTKAKFDTYFSVRTPLEQFTERRDILKNIPWEDFEKVQTSFKELEKLG